jgi:hypothetical protein
MELAYRIEPGWFITEGSQPPWPVQLHTTNTGSATPKRPRVSVHPTRPRMHVKPERARTQTRSSRDSSTRHSSSSMRPARCTVVRYTWSSRLTKGSGPPITTLRAKTGPRRIPKLYVISLRLGVRQSANHSHNCRNVSRELEGWVPKPSTPTPSRLNRSSTRLHLH